MKALRILLVLLVVPAMALAAQEPDVPTLQVGIEGSKGTSEDTSSAADLALRPGEIEHLESLGFVRLDELLRQSIRLRSLGAARDLLLAGASPDGVSLTRGYPLWRAAGSRQRAMVKLLLAYGADPNVTQPHGNTALMAAVMHDDEVVIKLLLDAGARVDCWDTSGRTAIDYALHWDREEVAELLRQHLASEHTLPSTQPN